MFKWIQGGISAVTGMAEPEYGPSHFHSVTSRVLAAKKNPYTKATASGKDFDFQNPQNTNVETATFYLNDLETGYCGFAQIIHSNIGITTTAQFTFKLYNNKIKDFKQIWTSTKLENFSIENGKDFKADNLQIQWNDDGSLKINSEVNPESLVTLIFKPLTNGVKFGQDPNTYYGPSIEEKWGSMRHVFMPRCTVEGTITDLKTGLVVDLTAGKTFGLYVMALQNMKPHHAAKEWRFVWFVNEKESLILMQFQTPKSYGNSIVSTAIITDEDKVICCPVENEATLIGEYKDEETGWSYAKEIDYKFKGQLIKDDDEDNEVESAGAVEFELKGPLVDVIERVDVMNEVPQFVKNIVSGVAATKPFIYQYYTEDLALTRSDEKESVIKGSAWVEVTYIVDEREQEQ
ncbi:hypothetical protein QEN19_001057 [Hanseniaspora menglaensis]